MTLSRLNIANFRNLLSVELLPTPAFNIFYGKNGSGKTSLLEAIYCLSTGRSFRSTSPAQLINHNQDKFSLFAQLMQDQRPIPIGMERQSNGILRCRLNERDIPSVVELAAMLPLRLINAHSHLILESGPTFRRKLLDWGLFYHSQEFYSHWRQFDRTLKQRNILLKAQRPKQEIIPWTYELIRHGLKLDQLRRQYVADLTHKIEMVLAQLFPLSPPSFTYHPGWDGDKTYEEILLSHLTQELQCGFTCFGPHRADLSITINGLPVKHFLSRGQQKLLICAIIMAQGILLTEQTHQTMIYLIDDLAAELDSSSRTRLISLLIKQQAQVFVTTIEGDMINHSIQPEANKLNKLFHVEQGIVIEQT